jgi:hypothetical protein
MTHPNQLANREDDANTKGRLSEPGVSVPGNQKKNGNESEPFSRVKPQLAALRLLVGVKCCLRGVHLFYQFLDPINRKLIVDRT